MYLLPLRGKSVSSTYVCFLMEQIDIISSHMLGLTQTPRNGMKQSKPYYLYGREVSRDNHAIQPLGVSHRPQAPCGPWSRPPSRVQSLDTIRKPPVCK
jgi:hypothetical protein